MLKRQKFDFYWSGLVLVNLKFRLPVVMFLLSKSGKIYFKSEWNLFLTSNFFPMRNVYRLKFFTKEIGISNCLLCVSNKNGNMTEKGTTTSKQMTDYVTSRNSVLHCWATLCVQNKSIFGMIYQAPMLFHLVLLWIWPRMNFPRSKTRKHDSTCPQSINLSRDFLVYSVAKSDRHYATLTAREEKWLRVSQN